MILARVSLFMDEIVKEFMLTGELKFLEIGMHRYQILQHIPELWRFATRKSRGTSDFLLGSLDLHFRRPYLASIRIYFGAEKSVLPAEIYEPRIIQNCPATLSQFISYLEDEGIAYTKGFEDEELIELALGNGVWVKFWDGTLSHIRRNPTEAEAIEIGDRIQNIVDGKASGRFENETN